jgi:hypothetical protein
METLRILVSIPLMIADALWSVITRDEEEAFIREQQAKFNAWANDQ